MAKAKTGENYHNDIVIHCPGCNELHVLNVSRPESPQWSFNGDMDKPTFTPSLLVRTGKYVQPDFDDEGYPELSIQCHSYITDGNIQFLDDTTHHLKGQTVTLPDIDAD